MKTSNIGSVVNFGQLTVKYGCTVRVDRFSTHTACKYFIRRYALGVLNLWKRGLKRSLEVGVYCLP